MYHLKRFWTPLIPYSWTNVKIGCYYCALYTALFHICYITYPLYIFNGGKSDEFYSPYFELNPYGTKIAGAITICFSLLFILSCVLLAYGVKHENRCMFFPWLIGMILELLILIAFGLWFMFRYYRNLYAFLVTLIVYTYCGGYVYCLLCVLSHYKELRDLQEPQFVILYP